MSLGHTAEELAKMDKRTCPVCGLTFAEFREHGRLGCSHDYVHFEKELEPLILNIHGETQHKGKSPRRNVGGTESITELIRLRREMKEAIGREDYEGAGKLRDQIKNVEEQSQQ